MLSAMVTGATFRSLSNANYRLWACGSAVANVGTWMQRIAQDWLVLTQLTHNDAAAVGVVMGLQFGPQVALLPITGLIADRFDRRKLLIITQLLMGTLALGLGLLALTGLITLWYVYAFALMLGCVSAFDAPVRQTFVGDMVSKADLANAVALNSTSWNAARLIGPAVAGALIAAVGTSWMFIINAASYLAVVAALVLLRTTEFHPTVRGSDARGGLGEGFRYVRGHPDLLAAVVILFLIGTFGINFTIFNSTMAVREFHADARGFGMLTSTMAIGSVIGALMAARRKTADLETLLAGAILFGAGLTLAALMPSFWSFAIVMIIVGAAAQTLMVTATSVAQLSTEPFMRGRVMAIVMAVSVGGTPIGAPITGWAANVFGPRWAICIGAAAGFAAALVCLRNLVAHRGLRLRIKSGRLQFDVQELVNQIDEKS